MRAGASEPVDGRCYARQRRRELERAITSCEAGGRDLTRGRVRAAEGSGSMARLGGPRRSAHSSARVPSQRLPGSQRAHDREIMASASSGERGKRRRLPMGGDSDTSEERGCRRPASVGVPHPTGAKPKITDECLIGLFRSRTIRPRSLPDGQRCRETIRNEKLQPNSNQLSTEAVAGGQSRSNDLDTTKFGGARAMGPPQGAQTFLKGCLFDR
jgi:hypothetical protein